MSCTVGEKNGYKYGESGHCYTFEANDESGRKEAKRKAIVQGVAIEGGTPKLEKADYEDLIDEETIIKLEPETMVKNNSNNCIFGWAYLAVDKDGVQQIDHSGELVKEADFEDMELAVYAYNLAFREADMQHDCIAKGYLVESMVFTKEKIKAMGIPDGILPKAAVWLGFHFPDDNDYNEICKMSKPMFSLYGKATKEVIEE